MKNLIFNLLKIFFFIYKKDNRQNQVAMANENEPGQGDVHYNEYVQYYQQATRWQSTGQE